jgi:hypothetical protein
MISQLMQSMLAIFWWIADAIDLRNGMNRLRQAMKYTLHRFDGN